MHQTTQVLQTNELVSIIIPCYNQAAFLKEAIESALNQTYQPLEILVIDDGSPDNISEVVRNYPQVMLFAQTNAGAAVARNHGIAKSKGSYLVFLDSDDRLLPTAVATGVQFLKQHPDISFVVGHVKLIDKQGNFLEIPHQAVVMENHYQTLLRSNFIWTPGVVMYRRALFEQQAGFDPRAGGSADYELNIRLARTNSVACLGEIVLEYRQHDANMTSRLAYMLKSGVSVRRAQYQHVKNDPALLKAWRSGIRIVQADVGRRLLQEVKTKAKDPKLLIHALRDLITLIQYYPKGLIKALIGK